MQTFYAIYGFIYEKWRDIPINVKTSIQQGNIIPIGHSLVKPTRVFFRYDFIVEKS